MRSATLNWAKRRPRRRSVSAFGTKRPTRGRTDVAAIVARFQISSDPPGCCEALRSRVPWTFCSSKRSTFFRSGGRVHQFETAYQMARCYSARTQRQRKKRRTEDRSNRRSQQDRIAFSSIIASQAAAGMEIGRPAGSGQFRAPGRPRCSRACHWAWPPGSCRRPRQTGRWLRWRWARGP
jgi:hypothetical protein